MAGQVDWVRPTTLATCHSTILVQPVPELSPLSPSGAPRRYVTSWLLLLQMLHAGSWYRTGRRSAVCLGKPGSTVACRTSVLCAVRADEGAQQ
jgi:hypothetical protein